VGGLQTGPPKTAILAYPQGSFSGKGFPRWSWKNARPVAFGDG